MQTALSLLSIWLLMNALLFVVMTPSANLTGAARRKEAYPSVSEVSIRLAGGAGCVPFMVSDDRNDRRWLQTRGGPA
ncbi:hypothetical protein G6321_00044380 [Bradyrhizobium barranii subsp. barranii]|uniref:Uncharacterized protein n=1 Tax=Bradyrhizobium barranii subsp. barranii TaxID=2823807 RepID=A0A7Z0QBF8_9BRAD|nr:hypothetical protein [Bradyrhizobium barranii]UGX92619.1 hypothetical protein G6321_00044380 [Bradyrhizobium barranii subsp. barranii]